VAFVTIKSDLEAMNQRRSGFEQAMSGTPVHVEQLIREVEAGRHEELEHVIINLVHSDEPVDAIIFATHYLTTVGLRVLRKLNVRIPKDLAVLSFDDIDAFDLVEPPVTSIAQPVESLGDRAMDILWAQLQGSALDNQNEILPTSLVVRASCGERIKSSQKN
jgi:LacI family transcriptional regulator